MKKIPRDMRTKTFTQLTAPGSTDSYEVADYAYHTVQYKVTVIQTNIVVKLQGSLDNENWFDITSSETITSNGTYKLDYEGNIRYICFNFVSESPSPSTAKVDVIYFGLMR